ncbi:hypothetical protein EZH22_30235 (plasmid) [Xanthobacter dioxanivorans]|uniref:SOS response associated peptidase (SRAP) n=1 Tax=Xanthobacter dioxanivorans TaxID=2528964 RepID=A0A974SM79_9HYPH|nr:hypothetical protein EZH22_30235 [Xanthobacter dioxanivorans]
MAKARPLAVFAGIWTPGWTCARKMKTGVETADLFGFLTTEPSEPVASVHPKAMPVILTEPEEVEIWMRAPWQPAAIIAAWSVTTSRRPSIPDTTSSSPMR